MHASSEEITIIREGPYIRVGYDIVRGIWAAILVGSPSYW